MRKQFGLKFEESDVERWDRYAGEHGLTRTTLIEEAVETLIKRKAAEMKLITHRFGGPAHHPRCKCPVCAPVRAS